MPLPIVSQFKALERCDVNGKVCRLLSSEPIPVYDSPLVDARVVRRLLPGSLLVAFSDPGEKLQINTGDQLFGYVERSLTLFPIEGIKPQTLYDAESRAAIESALPSLDQSRAAYAAQQRSNKRGQYYFAIGFFLVILFSTLVLLMRTSPAALQ